jgi:16S rRNA (adenine1518-N6/adenine1519-N6)-dimethyltransferase
LTLIELDRNFAEFWRTQDAKVIEADALQMEWKFSSEHVLVSNLPYQISSSLVIDRSIDSVPLKGMVLMFQREVAQRIRAIKQTEHYGMLSVIAQEFWTITTVCDAGPREFKPAPKVASRVLSFTPRISTLTDRQAYLRFVKICFKQRRRILTTNLKEYALFDVDRFQLWLDKTKKGAQVRAEELSPSEIRDLFEWLQN